MILRPPDKAMPPKISTQRKKEFDAEWEHNDEHIEIDTVKPFEAKDGYQAVSMTGGGVYKGYVKGGKFEGRGELKFANGDSYEGEFKEDYRHGGGVFRAAGYDAFTNGLLAKTKSTTFTLLMYQGEWCADLREGRGDALYSNGDRFSGEFKSNRPNGDEGVYLYGDGRKYEGSVRMGLRDGKGTLIMKNNDTYTGEFRGNKIHGKGVMRYGGGANTASGAAAIASKVKVFEGTFVDGKRVRGSMSHPDGKVYDGEWSPTTQKPNGVGKCTMRCGDVYRGEWVDGRMHGRGRLVYSSGVNKGRVYDGEWRDDKPHDHGCMLLPNGDLITCNWKEGKTDPDAPSEKARGKTVKDLPSLDWYKRRKSGKVVDDLDIEIDDLEIEGDIEIDDILDDLDVDLDDAPKAVVPPKAAGASPHIPEAPSQDGWCDGLEGWQLHDAVAQEDFSIEEAHHSILRKLRATGKVVASNSAKPPPPPPAASLQSQVEQAPANGGDGNMMLTAKVVHSGWLDKYSIGKSFLSFGNWKTRYFTLFSTGGPGKGGMLSYYTTEASDVQLGSINLGPAAKPRVFRSPTPQQHKKVSDPTRDLVLHYTEDDKEFNLLLRCNTQREHDAWVLYLGKVVENIQ